MYIIDAPQQDAPASSSRITPAEHHQWYLGYEAYCNGDPEPAHNEQAKGWRSAQAGCFVATQTDIYIGLGFSADYASSQAADTLKHLTWDIYDEATEAQQYGWQN